jgi:hypothetical protein
MAEPTQPAAEAQAPLAGLLIGAGLVYLGLGVMLGIVYFVGEVHSSLFPTGWLFPLVLVISGALMTVRRRFDIVATLWVGLSMAVFMLDVLLHVESLNLGLDNPGAFDATLIVAACGFVPLVLRPLFRV